MNHDARGARSRRRAARGAILLLLALALPLAAQKGFNQSEKAASEKFKRAQAHYNKGARYLKTGALDKAHREAMDSMEIYPDFADSHMLLAAIDYQRGKYESALEEVQKAKASFDAVSRFYESSYQDYFARLREQRDQLAERLADLVDSGSSTILVNEASNRLKAIDLQLREWRPSSGLELPAEYHFVHGNVLFKLKRPAEAEAMYRAAIAADPRHANAWNNLISLRFAAGDIAGAANCVREAEASGVVINEKLKQAVLDRQGK